MLLYYLCHLLTRASGDEYDFNFKFNSQHSPNRIRNCLAWVLNSDLPSSARKRGNCINKLSFLSCIVNVNITSWGHVLFSPLFFSRLSFMHKEIDSQKGQKVFRFSYRPLISLEWVSRSTRRNKIATIGTGSRF